jgi:hypothetical protein
MQDAVGRRETVKEVSKCVSDSKAAWIIVKIWQEVVKI